MRVDELMPTAANRKLWQFYIYPTLNGERGKLSRCSTVALIAIVVTCGVTKYAFFHVYIVIEIVPLGLSTAQYQRLLRLNWTLSPVVIMRAVCGPYRLLPDNVRTMVHRT